MGSDHSITPIKNLNEIYADFNYLESNLVHALFLCLSAESGKLTMKSNNHHCQNTCNSESFGRL